MKKKKKGWKRILVGVLAASMMMSNMTFVSAAQEENSNLTPVTEVTQGSVAASSEAPAGQDNQAQSEASSQSSEKESSQESSAVVSSTAAAETSSVAASTEESTTEESTTEEAVEMPAVDFGQFDAGNMYVTISAPEGAFEKGTTVSVTPVSVSQDVASKVEQQVTQSGDQTQGTMMAADITFTGPNGEKDVQPKKAISVVFSSKELAGSTAQVYHVSDQGDVELKAEKTDASASDVAVDDANSFSVYVCTLTVSDTESDTITYHYDYTGNTDTSATKVDLDGQTDLKNVTLSDGKDVTRSGYHVIGWSKAKDGATVDYAPSAVTDLTTVFTTENTNLDLYAVWETAENRPFTDTELTKNEISINGTPLDANVTADVKNGDIVTVAFAWTIANKANSIIR